MKTEFKAVPVVGFKVLDDDQGIVTALVSVTGVEDEVKDIIIPGSYAKTLAARTPKGVWSHTWETPVSKTVQAEELMPGDTRLPKKQRNGEAWPKEAGALLVETQFNLDTQRGREAFSDVKFFGDEQEWSIGYSVPVGGAKIDPKTGTRYIKEIDLFEYSPVLFGAMPLTTTTSSKGGDEREPVREMQLAYKALKDAADAVTFVEEEKGAHVFKPSDDDATVCATCGHEEDYDEDDVYHKPADDDEKALVVVEVDGKWGLAVIDSAWELTGTVTAWDTEDEAKAAYDAVVEFAKALEDAGDPDPKEPAVAADPANPQPGSAGTDLPVVEGDDGNGPEPTVSVQEDEKGQIVVNVTGAPDAEAVADAIKAHMVKKADEAKVWANTPGSYEQRIRAVSDACSEWARTNVGPSYAYVGAYPEATYEDRVLFCVYVEERTSWEQFMFASDYSYEEGSDEAILGEPVEVTVEAVIVEKALRKALSDKAGRVLSSTNAEKLVGMVSGLIDLLDSAGIEHPFSTDAAKGAGGAEEEKEGAEETVSGELGDVVLLDPSTLTQIELLKIAL